MCVTDSAQTAQQILTYLVNHEGAQDTLEGIVEWWLLEQKIRTRMAEVETALDYLISEGLILVRKGIDARVHYCMNNRRQEEICKLLNQTIDH
jgi:hypothetical protein